MDEKHLSAYLWDDAPAALRDRVHTRGTPQMLWVVPARWVARADTALLPRMLTNLIRGHVHSEWLGVLESFHQPDGSLLIVCYRAADI